jgi:hypothetical protein
MIDPTEAGTWFVAAKAGVEALKSAWSLLPRGADKDALASKIEEAEQAIERADAKLAKELGYKLCRCTFPPQIMLWQKSTNSDVCPNPACNHRIERPKATRVWRSDSFGGGG